jgi:hypothetical protein
MPNQNRYSWDSSGYLKRSYQLVVRYWRYWRWNHPSHSQTLTSGSLPSRRNLGLDAQIWSKKKASVILCQPTQWATLFEARVHWVPGNTRRWGMPWNWDRPIGLSSTTPFQSHGCTSHWDSADSKHLQGRNCATQPVGQHEARTTIPNSPTSKNLRAFSNHPKLSQVHGPRVG